MFRRWLLLCVCALPLVGCGHPIRELAKAAKDLIPEKDADDTASCLARATTRIALIANLDARAELGPGWDPAQPEGSSDFALDSSAYAADGHPVELRIFFARTGDHAWSWHVLGGSPAAERGTGTLSFDADGALTGAEAGVLLRLPRADGSLGAPVVLSFGTPRGADSDGFDGVTSTPERSQLISYEQDGGDC